MAPTTTYCGKLNTYRYKHDMAHPGAMYLFGASPSFYLTYDNIIDFATGYKIIRRLGWVSIFYSVMSKIISSKRFPKNSDWQLCLKWFLLL